MCARDLVVAMFVAAGVACGCTDSSTVPHADAPIQQPRPDAAEQPQADGASPADDAAAASIDAAAAVADAGPPDATMTVVLMPEGKPEARAYVTLARTQREQQVGLMYVQHMPPDDGMLFIFPDERVNTFWMKNTLIPLDMIFIRDNMTVVGIVENAQPLTLTPRGVNEPSRFVLEVNGGWSATHGITKETKVRFEGFTP